MLKKTVLAPERKLNISERLIEGFEWVEVDVHHLLFSVENTKLHLMHIGSCIILIFE